MTEAHHFVFIDPMELKQSHDLRAGDDARTTALLALVEVADRALAEPPTSVLDKSGIAPSGNKQDFWAIGAYSWPDPAKDDGLPYIYRDSEYNPEAYQSDSYDKGRYARMVASTKHLSLAWYLTGNERYADKAASLLRSWFIHPKTRMNPNFRYAAARPGVFDGHHSGVIEGAVLIELLDYVALLESSPSLTREDMIALRRWFCDLSEWYACSAFGRAEAATVNNHSSYYLAQTMSFASFGGNHDRARAIVPIAKRQLRAQIASDGSMPREISRPNSFYYAVYGLRAFVILARLADRYGEDLWKYRDRRNLPPALVRGLSWLAPYCAGEKDWVLPTRDSLPPRDALPVYWIAARAYEARLPHLIVAHLSRQARADSAALVYRPQQWTTSSEDDWFESSQSLPRSRSAFGTRRDRAWRKVRSALVASRVMPEGRLP